MPNALRPLSSQAAAEFEGPRFSRYFFPTDVDAPLDEHGLLVDDLAELARRASQAFRIDDLSRQKFVLILGPPHSGKSHSMKELVQWGEQQGFFLHTDVRALGNLVQGPPRNWDAWRTSTANAVWCVDAIDEATDGTKAYLGVAQMVEDLQKEERDRLRLLVSCRENERPPDFVERVSRVMGPPLQVRIAAPSWREAEAICGGTNRLTAVLRCMERNSMQELAEHPAVLKSLAANIDGLPQLDRARAWRSVIEGLLVQPFGEGKLPPGRREDRFKAATRVGFMLHFGNFDVVSTAGPTISLHGPHVEHLFSESEGALLDGVRAAIRSALFQPVAGAYRIRHRHLREWLAAWELLTLGDRDRWEQVRELLGGDNFRRDLVPTAHALSDILGGRPEMSELRKWLVATISQHAEHLLAGLFEAAQGAPVSIASRDLLKQVVHQVPLGALNNVLKRQAEDWSSLSPAVKDLVFSLAEVVRSPSVHDAAKRSLNDSSEDEDVRTTALRYLVSTGETIDLRALISRERDRETNDHSVFVSVVLLQGLRTGGMTVQEVLSLGVSRQDGVFDARALLEHEVALRLAPEDAIFVLQRFATRDERHYPLVNRAVEVLARAPRDDALAERAAAAIRRAADERNFDAMRAWQNVLAGSAEIRRHVYEDWLTSGEGFELDFHLRVALTHVDIPWLLGMLGRFKVPPTVLVEDLLRISRGRATEGTVLEELRSAAPSVVSSVLAQRAEHERQMDELRAQHEAKRPRRMRLEDALAEKIARAEGPSERLRIMGWLAFAGRGVRPGNIDGTFDALPSGVQAAMLGELKASVPEAEPTPVPDGSTIPGNVVCEAASVAEAIGRFGAEAFDRETIARWLPTLLRMLDTDDALHACAHVYPEETVAAFGEWLERDVREQDRSAFTAARAPTLLWEAGLADAAIGVLQNEILPSNGRAPLLLELNRHVPGVATRVAVGWINNDNSDARLRTASIRVLLQTGPALAIEALKKDTDHRGRQALFDLADSLDFFTGVHVSLEDWAEPDLERLATLLVEYQPEEEDPRHPPGEAHWVGSKERLVEFRNRTLAALFHRNTPTSRAVLNGFSEKMPVLADRLRQRDAERRASSLLNEALVRTSAAATSAPPATPQRPYGIPASREGPPRQALPLEKLMSLLRWKDYRLARTNADLLRILREVFDRIADDVVDDLVIFYPNRFHKGHAIEDVLRTYVCRRLSDHMPGRVIDREAWMPLNRRADICVRVEYPDVGSRSEVPIEVKWSDDPRTTTAAGLQLGKSYMLAPKLTHGLYLVGWSGKTQPVNLGEAGLREAVQADVHDFESANPGYVVHTVWLPLSPEAVLHQNQPATKHGPPEVTTVRGKPPKANTPREARNKSSRGQKGTKKVRKRSPGAVKPGRR